MIEMDSSAIDKISEPYERHIHENKTTQHRFKSKLSNTYGLSSSPFIRWKDGRRLRLAASYNNSERVKELLEKGVNPNLPDESGRTALHLACSRGFAGVVQLLLANNADCNAVDKLGNTPLHLAVCTNSKMTVDLLLKAGCCVSKRGNNGCTPLQLAQTKLWLMQRHKRSDNNSLKTELAEVISMMKKLVEEKSQEAELVNAFSSQLNLRQTNDEMVEDVKQLLDNLSSLNINKTLSKSGKCQLPSDGDKSDELNRHENHLH